MTGSSAAASEMLSTQSSNSVPVSSAMRRSRSRTKLFFATNSPIFSSTKFSASWQTGQSKRRSGSAGLRVLMMNRQVLMPN
jgi:hypothetical protein